MTSGMRMPLLSAERLLLAASLCLLALGGQRLLSRGANDGARDGYAAGPSRLLREAAPLAPLGSSVMGRSHRLRRRQHCGALDSIRSARRSRRRHRAAARPRGST